jgi:hypothetical protein
MKEPAVALIVFCVSMLTLAGLVILQINSRLGHTNLRGGPLLQTESLIILAVFGGLVVLGGRQWTGIWAYALSPMTAFVIVVAYVLGTARFD